MRFSCALLISSLVSAAGDPQQQNYGDPALPADMQDLLQKFQSCLETSKMMSLYADPNCQLFSASGLTATASNADIESMCSSSCYTSFREANMKFATCYSRAMDEYSSGLDASTKKMYSDLGDSLTGAMSKQLDFMCTKNIATGDFCLHTPPPPDGLQGFESMCPSFFDMGCCFASLLDSTTLDLYTKQCNWPAVPKACPAPGVTVTVVETIVEFPQITLSEFEALSPDEQKKWLLAFAEDFAGGANPADLNVKVISGANLDLQIVVAAQGASMEAILATGAANTDWTNFQSEVSDSGNGAALEASPPKEITTQEVKGLGRTDADNNGATAGAPSGVFFFLASLLVILFLQ